ncbi:hypothetical protein [Xenorhabdus ehlersii]|uniref:Uncharacterized protein n=2 Tax=Xenorhabdus ehlersii TaxID=290111 RepID=A0A2D0IMH6_9GAMM|nr:hypothetical protein Xehl_03225 [Xenorhabdus ehlersii]RKE92659.1 hypothetical protein BDE27_0315 [Xenorhabdus ehlersii]
MTMARNAIERLNNSAGHNYQWSVMCRVHICEKCGTAEHRSGWYWWAGYKSKVEPPCYQRCTEGDLLKWQEDDAIFEGL